LRASPLFSANGTLNPAGTYFFNKRGQEPPDVRYDHTQTPVVSGKREYITRGDGTKAVSRSFNGHEWLFYQSRQALLLGEV
jgi:hypothetical protein